MDVGDYGNSSLLTQAYYFLQSTSRSRTRLAYLKLQNVSKPSKNSQIFAANIFLFFSREQNRPWGLSILLYTVCKGLFAGGKEAAALCL
jgi:hypothetical protein